MTAVQPFSYLTVQPPPSKPAFQRQDDPVETEVSTGGFRSGDPNTLEDVGQLSHSIATLPFQGDYQRPQVNLGRAQTETSYDLRQHQQQQQQAEVALRQQQQQQQEVALRQQQEVALRQQQEATLRQQQQQEVALRQQQQQEATLRQQQQQQEVAMRQQQQEAASRQQQQEVALRQQQQEVALRQQQQQQQEATLRQQQQQEVALRQQQQQQQEVALRQQQQQQQEATLRQQQQLLQQEVTLRQQQQQQKPEVAYIETRVKRPPDVAPKHTKDPRMPENNWESSKEEGGFHGATKGGALYSQTNPLTLERIQEKTEPVRDPDFGNANNLYGQPNRNRGSDGQDGRKVSSQYAPPNDVPFSYTQPLGLSGGVAYGDVESRNGVGAKYQYPTSELGNRPRDSPAVSSIENQTIFENFILVGPEKPQTKETAPKEQPVKRLKLQELFDPPPQQAAPAAAQDSRKLSIFGVTNTESCDYHSTNHSKPRDNSDRTKTKTPVSTFDNPDYNFQDRPYTPSGSLQGMSDERPWSVGANTTLDGAGKSPAGASKQRRPAQGRSQSNKMCIAVLITALVTSLFCLGAGFIAGWFGRGRALGC